MRELRHVSAAFLMMFACLAVAAIYWSVVQHNNLSQRPDNPRLVEEEINTQRGNIYDHQGFLLATTTTTYNDTGLRRLYPYPAVAPTVGYYSMRYGTSGIEATYDDLLSGRNVTSPLAEFSQRILHLPRVGGDVRLTLDLPTQNATAAALGTYQGAAVVITIPDGKVRALVSAPTYNANALDENWQVLVSAENAPLLNRVTQGIYQPGGILQSTFIAMELTAGLDLDAPILDPLSPVEVNGLTLGCAMPPDLDSSSIADAYRYACPGAFTAIDAENLPLVDEAFWRFGLTTLPDLFGLNTAIADSPVALSMQENEETIIAELTGQGVLTITPLQALDLIAAIANGGNIPLYTLVDATRLPGTEEWTMIDQTGLSRAVLTQENATRMQGLLTTATTQGVAAPAQEASTFPVMGHAATAYSGPEAMPLQWFIGMTRFTDGSALATVVLLEDAPTPAEAAHVGGIILDAAAQTFQPIEEITGSPTTDASPPLQ